MFTHYIKSYLVGFKKNRFFYGINLFGFSVGFLLLTIIFSFVYQELSFDKFHKNSDTIYRIHGGGYGVTPLCFADKLKNKIPEIRNVIRFKYKALKIDKNNEKLDFGDIYFADPELFQEFSFKLLFGNASEVLKEPYSMVINKSKARELFKSNSPIGNTITDENGVIYTITGIMEDIPYHSHLQAEAFISIETIRHTEGEDAFNCGSWSNLTYVCLSERAVCSQVETKINNVLENFKMRSSDGKMPLSLEPLGKIYFDAENNKYDGSIHGNFQTVLLYLAISILILFLVVINYINLSIAISVTRIKEMAIRKVNGAKQSQIIKQTVFEAITTAVISFCLAILLIELFLPQLCILLNVNVSNSLNRLKLYLIYFLGIVFIGLITGLFPGVFLSKVKVINALKNDMGFKSRGFQRKILLVFQLLIVATLLNASFIINSQINYVFNKDLGFDYENVLSFKLTSEIAQKSKLLKHKLLENPNIKVVSFSNSILGEAFGKAPIGNDNNIHICNQCYIDPSYLNLYDIKIKEGRNFSWDMNTDVKNACLLNEEACRVFGTNNSVNTKLENSEVIGVVSDFNFSSLHNQIEPLVIYCTDKGDIVQVKISSANQKSTIQYIGDVCKIISPDFDFNYEFVENRIKKMYKSEIDLKSSFQFYSLITFFIALLGLLGLTLFLIKKKIKEVSIRKLFGAKLNNTLMLLSKEQIMIVLIANTIAIPITYLIMEKWLSNFQFRIDIGCLIFIKTLIITIFLTVLAVSFIIFKIQKVNVIENLGGE
ncbi:ABC transporter permease [Ancylomarina sp. 16SWW S1-10-2]|uniref:ABC transporter permease n=1 Tax=Ancylomarina sp. 16SWW S1-10-2 TaxID=2499681 RepID=UPI0012AE1C43|nr:ABC transporter permease [Ancylomarina sp. 16SWW S1-10-2]MRT92714.1 ABC transporter permease [Ancylomarina sp. 16SWW S1-10-2]